MLSKYRCATAARVSAESACWPSFRVCLNHSRKRFISGDTREDGGASKCTRGTSILPETTCIGSVPVRNLPTSFKSRLPETIIPCHRNSISGDNGLENERYK